MKKAIAHLRRSDPVLGRAMKGITLDHSSWHDRGHFESLVIAIANQQLSGKAAGTIVKRFIALFPGTRFPSPAEVLKVPPAKLRKTGLSGMKVKFIKDLARKTLGGEIDFKKMSRWTDEEVIEHLTRVKGIGRWTAEMFLMFSLGREDVFSYGDLGLRNAMQKLYGLRRHPTPAQAERISSKWRPYRTLASFYLWASVDKKGK